MQISHSMFLSRQRFLKGDTPLYKLNITAPKDMVWNRVRVSRSALHFLTQIFREYFPGLLLNSSGYHIVSFQTTIDIYVTLRGFLICKLNTVIFKLQMELEWQVNILSVTVCKCFLSALCFRLICSNRCLLLTKAWSLWILAWLCLLANFICNVSFQKMAYLYHV